MADKKIQLKRNNAGTIDNMFPVARITDIVESDGTTSFLDSGKIRSSYLPSYVVGGLKFYATQSLATSTSLATIFGSLLTFSTTADEALQKAGNYVIVTTGGDITTNSPTAGSSAGYQLNAPGDETDDSTPVTLEAGDWIVFRQQTLSGSGGTLLVVYYFDIINNTYRDADGSNKGIVTLSTATATTSMNGSSKVITEDVLYDTIGTSSGKIAAGDHNHSGVYQPVDGDLTALSALSGTGFVKRTGVDTYTLDTNTYLTSQANDFGVITVTDTDSGHTYASTGSATSDTTADTLTLVDGDGVDIDVSSTTDAIRIQHTDTSSLSGAQGSAGIASITVDGYGHVTAVTTATYNNYSLPLAANGTRGGLQIGFTSTELNRALLLSSEQGYIALPRQIPAVTLNGASSTSPSFYAPTGSGATGSTSQVKQALIAQTGAAPIWGDSPVIYYDTTSGTTHGDIIFDEI